MLAWAYQLDFDFDLTNQSHLEQTLKSPFDSKLGKEGSVSLGSVLLNSRTRFVLQCRCVFRRRGWPWPGKNFISQNFSMDVLLSGFASLAAGSWLNTVMLLLTMVFPAVKKPIRFCCRLGAMPAQHMKSPSSGRHFYGKPALELLIFGQTCQAS